jgi:hypothetical protein
MTPEQVAKLLQSLPQIAAQQQPQAPQYLSMWDLLERLAGGPQNIGRGRGR